MRGEGEGGGGLNGDRGLWCVETSADIPSVRFFELNPVTVLCVLLLLQKITRTRHILTQLYI